MSKMNETAAARYVASNDLYRAYLNQGRVERSKAVRGAFAALGGWMRGAAAEAPAARTSQATGARTA
ncbi:MAG: hypothetical protein AAF676_10780 [Pseudomonadota bacterium]